VYIYDFSVEDFQALASVKVSHAEKRHASFQGKDKISRSEPMIDFGIFS
jgi:hypothetical protein